MKKGCLQMKAAGFRAYQRCFHGAIHFHKSMAGETQREERWSRGGEARATMGLNLLPCTV
jgi:hypothetical protein